MVNEKPDLDLVPTHELAIALADRLQTGIVVYMHPTNSKPICRSIVKGRIAELDPRLVAAMNMVIDAHPKPKQNPKKKGKS